MHKIFTKKDIEKNWRKFSSILLAILLIFFFNSQNCIAVPLYGPSPGNAVNSNQAPSGGNDLPQSPSGAVPSLNGPGFNGPSPGSSPQGGSSPGPNSGQPGMIPGQGTSPQPIAPGSPQPTTSAPTFMNSSMPNQSNPFLPSVISPGQLSGPLENAYLQDGIPQLAAPLMSAVYRPFGLTFFQPDPFQVVPQGSVSLSGYFETDTNIDFSPNKPEVGSFFAITPAVMYSNFDDYGYISLMANASYYQYDTGNIPPYFDEMGGISAGTYLGTRVFVGAQDFVMNGSTPMMNGQPLAFFNGINGFYENMADAEVGVALTPKISFTQAASDIYADDTSFNAGLMNIQSILDSINFVDKSDYFSANYMYQQGIFSDFPGYISNGVMATIMRFVSPTTSLGVGGSLLYYFFQNQPTLNYMMSVYYGIITHNFTRNFFISAEGGWNAISIPNGPTFQSPMWDVNLGYTGPRLSLGVNVGEFMANINSYGVETGPENMYMAIGYLTYKLGAKTSFYSSAGYDYYNFFNAPGYSGNFFQNLQPSISYNATMINQTDGISYHPYSWLMTSLSYNLIDFITNLPNSSVIDNQFIAQVTFFWNFN